MIISNLLDAPANGSVYIPALTNLSLPLAQWTRLATNQFDNSGNLSFTNSLTLNTPQAFYLLQLPWKVCSRKVSEALHRLNTSISANPVPYNFIRANHSTNPNL